MLHLSLKPLIRFYQVVLSPILHFICGPGYGCRFVPSCSEYAREAFQNYGLIKGFYLSAWRISRCQPFARAGYDPIPRDIGKPYLNPHPHSGR